MSEILNIDTRDGQRDCKEISDLSDKEMKNDTESKTVVYNYNNFLEKGIKIQPKDFILLFYIVIKF